MATMAASRAVDAASARSLREAKGALVRAGNNSVRAAWRFGQAIDNALEHYTRAQIAAEVGLSVGSTYRYTRLYYCYQRPELAVEAAERLETYNVDIIAELSGHDGPVEHGRPLAGRRFAYVCRSCGSHEVGRDEIEPDDGAE